MAEYLWTNNKRHISIEKLVSLIDHQSVDTLQWEKSRTKAILDEGLIVCRNWHNRGEVIYFTYDLLGGYLIADYLLQNIPENIESSINSEELSTKLFSEDFKQLHPLYEDISKCLAALIPVKTGRYLHELTDNKKAFSLSVEAIFEIPPDKINQDCIDLIAKLFITPRNQQSLLTLSFSTIAHVKHPLNAEFWSEELKKLSMPDRDISWTEHIRSNSDWFEKTIIRFETLCQSEETLSDMMQKRLNLLARHIMWVLTSTVRTLRDKATKALYWYGRRQPEQLLDLVLYSLEINDPYVSERMLAAIYGVAMARQYDFKDSSFTKEVLPLYGGKLFEAIFKISAPHCTTHILARDYAKGTIEIALIHHPNLLTNREKQKVIPPFLGCCVQDWKESEEQDTDKYKDGNCPLHPDFENYTLGRLVKDRSNYDFHNNEYKKVKANIIWRIYDLGYSINIFGEIDKLITRYNWNQKDNSKIDRYGKKYSWIAFFELAGFRNDYNLLPRYSEDIRIDDTDIDPSFPERLQESNLVKSDFLGDRNLTSGEWILEGGIPNLNPYFIVNDLCGNPGNWVLLDGYISQDEKKNNRRRFIFIRGFIAKANEKEELRHRLEKQKLGNMWLPGIPENYYTYAGEIAQSDTYPANGIIELDFESNYALLRNGESVSQDEIDDFMESVSEFIETENEQSFEAALKERGLELVETIIEEDKQLKVQEMFSVLIPVRKNIWEDYHSHVNLGRSVTLPAKEIIECLNLCTQPQTFDLFEKNGKRASITFCYGNSWNSTQNFTFLRQDLLERFLCKSDSELIWAIWGARELSSSMDNSNKYHTLRKKHGCLNNGFQEIKAYGDIKNI